MRLGGWQRIGIVAAIIWVFVGGFWGNSIGLHEGDWARNVLSTCYLIHPNGLARLRRHFREPVCRSRQVSLVCSGFCGLRTNPNSVAVGDRTSKAPSVDWGWLQALEAALTRRTGLQPSNLSAAASSAARG
jgi:hypothetical protein